MASTPDLARNAGNDLRAIGEALLRISHLLHEHTRKLEFAVEGNYPGEMDNPRVALLSDSLNMSRVADIELSKLNQSISNVLQTLQMLPSAPSQGSSPSTNLKFEREREALTTSISNLQKERNELNILYEIARTLNSTLEFDEVLRLVMDRVIEFVDAERGFLMLVKPTTGRPEFRMARDKAARTIPESEFSTAQISRSTIMRVIHTRIPVLTDDAQVDKSLQGMESILTYGIRSIMCAPLIVRDTCIGVVYVDSRINANLFGAKHRDLLLAFCNQAAIAIDNARLFADLNTAIQQVKEDKRYMDNIFKSIANGIITTDSAGIITTFNAGASIILHINPTTAISKHYQEVFRTIPETGLSELLRNAPLQQEHHSTVAIHAVECKIPGREGEINLNCYVSSLRDSQGAHIGMALVIDDRTELKRSEAQTRQIRRIFERYVHPNVVQQLIKDPMALNLGGETKEISVVFADIRGYTSLSERMAPEDVMNLINRYLQIMCEALWEEQGTITAFQGDALMAIFNAPLEQKNHALRAVRSAWKMREAVEKYQRSQPQETMVRYGIGVNTGLATVGNIGSQERLQNYTAIGDVVNVASRLQNNVTDNNILLNDMTYIQVYRHVKVGQPFPLQVKNKAAALNVRYLMGLV